jgi:SagB-type dehydrogenase family enzyme
MGVHLMRALLGLAPDAALTATGIDGPYTRTVSRNLPLLALLERRASLEELDESTDGDVRPILDVLHRRQHLAWFVVDDEGRAVMTLRTLIRDVPLPVPRPGARRGRLSRFALLRRDERWLLESGRSAFVAVLSDRIAGDLIAGEEQSVDATAIGLLSAAGLLEDADVDAGEMWEFHDRYFVARATTDIRPSAGTFRFAGRMSAEPMQLDETEAMRIDLPLPVEGAPGPGLWDVSHRRRTIRAFSTDPVPLAALSELLWRTLRVTHVLPQHVEDPTSYDGALKPVPSAGAIHALALWLVCHNVDGIEAGPWRYDAVRHALVRPASTDPYPADAPLDGGGAAVSGFLVLRHARLAWKYERIAVSLALKDCGVLLHALQLNAVALGLALQPLGAGPTTQIARVLGRDPERDVPLGDFWLGLPDLP